MKILRLGQSLCSSNGGGGSETRFVFSVDTSVAGSTGTGKFALPISGSGINCDVDWGDGSTDTGVTAAITHTYSSATTYTIKISGTLKGWAFNNGGDKFKMKEITNWGVLDVSVSSAFYGCNAMTCTATDAPTISTGNLQFTFRTCTQFNGNIGNWDVSGVNNMVGLFFSCSVFNQDISSWDVSNVTTFQRTFRNATAFNQDISGWNVSNATNMREMFRSATAFNQSLNSWQVQKLSDITNFMDGKTAADYDSSKLAAIYTSWSAYTFVNTGLSINFGSIEYDASGAAGRLVLESAPNLWSVADGGEA